MSKSDVLREELGSKAILKVWGAFDAIIVRALAEADPIILSGYEVLAKRSCGACHIPLDVSLVGAPDLSITADELTVDEI